MAGRLSGEEEEPTSREILQVSVASSAKEIVFDGGRQKAKQIIE
jgi:hypothetical protein